MNIKGFLKRYAQNKHTEQEHRDFIAWLDKQSLNEVARMLKGYYHIVKDDPHIRDDFKQMLTEDKRNELLAKISHQIYDSNDNVKSIKRYRAIQKVAVAVAVFVISICTFIYYSQRIKDEPHVKFADVTTDVMRITLQDGSLINLDSLNTGEEIIQGVVKIHRATDGQLVYTVSEGEHVVPNGHNTISTPRGKQSFVKLADGTEIWLNAASSLKFPVNFSSHERTVELDGEAYFEVKKDNRTFRVITDRQEIEVLGTHFNVEAYKDDRYARTTLLEGSVKLHESKSNQAQILHPGEQGISSDHKRLYVERVNAGEAIGWKQGLFIFSNESIHTIMKEVSRWYNVEIVYEGQVTNEKFVMNISKSKNVNDVLDKLETTGLVHFKFEEGENPGKERRIIVMP